ncbi:MAG TPA: hypothetical protein VD766_12890 [Solirubrobacterales bacterium]|nr:hypothetical protein [Solirubrobacterales bacterium]
METAIKTQTGARRPHARALVAGTGVTAALIAAAVAAFVSIGAFVAFEGMPFSSADTPENSVAVSDALSGAPNAAALAASPAAAAVAADPATPSAAAAAEIAAALPSVPSADGPSNDAAGISGVETPGAGGATDIGGPVVTPESPGPLGSTVQGVDDTAGGLGLDLPLDETTGGITDPVDDVVGGVLDGVGAGGLDDKVGDVVGGVLGGN